MSTNTTPATITHLVGIAGELAAVARTTLLVTRKTQPLATGVFFAYRRSPIGGTAR